MNFLRDYLTYSAGNEAPQVFHDWCAIMTICNALGRRVWVNQGLFRVYPHLYLMLVGNPASGKSFAMSLARRLVTEIGSIHIAPSIVTREAITLEMGSDKPPCRKEFKGPDDKLWTFSQCSFFSDELLNLLGRTPEPIMNFFLEAWSQDIINVGTKGKGNDVIINPCVNLLGCMTPDVTSSLIKQQLLSTGFMRRVIWVNSSARGEPVPRPQYTEAQKGAYAACLQRGRELLKISGEFTWEPEAAEYFDSWYRLNHKRMNAPGVTSVMVNMLRSRDQFVLKVAMATTLAHTNELVLRRPALEFAVTMLENIEDAAFRTFEHTGRNELAFLSTKIADFVASNTSGPTPIKQVYLLAHADANMAETDAVINHLVQTERLKRCTAKIGNISKDVLCTPEQYARIQQELTNALQSKLAAQQTTPVPDASVSPAKSAPDEL
jgi:hypothetical protein